MVTVEKPTKFVKAVRRHEGRIIDVLVGDSWIPAATVVKDMGKFDYIYLCASVLPMYREHDGLRIDYGACGER